MLLAGSGVDKRLLGGRRFFNSLALVSVVYIGYSLGHDVSRGVRFLYRGGLLTLAAGGGGGD